MLHGWHSSRRNNKTTTTSPIVALVALLGCVSCALPAEDEVDEPVGLDSEALNLAPNVKFGVQTLLGSIQGPVQNAPSLSEIALGSGLGGSAWAGLPSPSTNPNGLRLTMTRLTSGISLETVDFRIGLVASDLGEKSGDASWTGWASEGGGWSRGSTDGGDRKDADFFAVVVQLRTWPAANNKRLRDVAVQLQACESNFVPPSFKNCDAQLGNITHTSWVSSLAPGSPSSTGIATNLNGTAIDGVKICLLTQLQ